LSGNNSSRISVVGLTGGIASGKNFVAEIFSKNGAAIFDADKEVHLLLESNQDVIAQIKKNFPQSLVNHKIDRKILGKIVFDKKSAQKLKILEEILHPKVRSKYQDFLSDAKKSNKKIVVLNIPLLHETKAYESDYVVAVIASPSVRKKRFLVRERLKDKEGFAKRKSDLEKKFDQIQKNQLSNRQQIQNADFVINTNSSKAKTVEDVKLLIRQLLC